MYTCMYDAFNCYFALYETKFGYKFSGPMTDDLPCITYDNV